MRLTYRWQIGEKGMDAEFEIGDWRVDVPRNRLFRSDHPEHSVRIEPKAMQVLVYLAQHAGEVVEKETVVKEVWEGAFVTDEVLTNAIWELRKALGDDSKSARFIQTVPRKGYRLIANVQKNAPFAPTSIAKIWSPAILWSLLAVASILIIFALRGLQRTTPPPEVVARFPVEIEGNLGPLYVPALALSPDASNIIYVSAPEDGGRPRLYRRAMDQMTSAPVPGTEGALAPFLSPDETGWALSRAASSEK